MVSLEQPGIADTHLLILGRFHPCVRATATTALERASLLDESEKS